MQLQQTTATSVIGSNSSNNKKETARTKQQQNQRQARNISSSSRNSNNIRIKSNSSNSNSKLAFQLSLCNLQNDQNQIMSNKLSQFFCKHTEHTYSDKFDNFYSRCSAQSVENVVLWSKNHWPRCTNFQKIRRFHCLLSLVLTHPLEFGDRRCGGDNGLAKNFEQASAQKIIEILSPPGSNLANDHCTCTVRGSDGDRKWETLPGRLVILYWINEHRPEYPMSTCPVFGHGPAKSEHGPAKSEHGPGSENVIEHGPKPKCRCDTC